MAERAHLDWFRERLAASARDRAEGSGADPGVARGARRGAIQFKAELIGLDEVRGWSRDAQGNVRHKTGQFFGVEGVRIESGDLREVASWDQPIYTQPEGGILGLVARETAGERRPVPAPRQGGAGKYRRASALADHSKHVVEHPARAWRQAVADGGSADRRSPAFGSSTARSTMKRAAGSGASRTRTSSCFVDDEGVIETDMTMFCWASLSQIKELALMDNVLSPFVKTIMAPL